MITIFTMAFNEELLLQFMIDHYRSRFPNCRIVLYDNQSVDNTAAIAKQNGCEILEYNTNGLVDDEKLRIHKSNCWKGASTNWVLVCDVDELLDINEEDLKREESLGTSIIRSEAYNMINHEDNYNIAGMSYGVREPGYDKYYLFNKAMLKEINYSHGAHICSPSGIIKLSEHPYKLYHYKYINLNRLLSRSKMTVSRHSEINTKNNWGWHNAQTEEQITSYWNHIKSISTKIR